jgi:excisionase family DNA binding protein
VPRAGTVSRPVVPEKLQSLPAGPPQKLAYSKSEAAELLSISESLLSDLIADGSIRTVSAGRRLLVPLVALNDFLAGN